MLTTTALTFASQILRSSVLLNGTYKHHVPVFGIKPQVVLRM